MIYLPLDMRKFNRWAAQRDLVKNNVFDKGYAFHIFLCSTFGKSTLQPFRLFASDRSRNASIYAYSDCESESLREMARTVGTPDCLAVVDLESILSKPMRFEFPSGQLLGFDVQIRPVRRLLRDLYDSKSQTTFSKGSEIDAFRVKLIREYPRGWSEKEYISKNRGESRPKIYIEWLIERLGDSVEIDPNDCHLKSYQRTRLWRGDRVGSEGPEAVIHGCLTVAKADKFAAIVRKGVGRHKAYGYGMLMLRPPKSH